MGTTFKQCYSYTYTLWNRHVSSFLSSYDSFLVLSKKMPIAFWRDEVQPYKDKSVFSHSVWISAGKPINTELHRIMKRSRNAYQIRMNKKLAENLKKNSFLNACINNNEDIFKLIRKERATTTSVPTTMDGVSMDRENHFASIYKTLYNSVGALIKKD